ncbi:LysR substrate-binding domain-containing protein [Bradyrhizobium sp. Leo170]|uniref:LysR substrate-binding domain-containing protein n=1 Tax=Bradyrhizobium sp. Leo170 TaxID=1571199 RepID=UPI001FDFA235|nr:LysR substrate-binding domain-containing protein [Bradyrhizobium sp. Leo170]
MQGPITVTSVDWLGDYVLAPILARFTVSHPLVDIQLINDGRHYNLSRREADLAVRFGSFSQEDLYERKVAEIHYGLYVSPKYLAECGHPDFSTSCSGHRVVTLQELPGRATLGAWLQRLAPEARPVLRANTMWAQMSVAENGAAIAALPRALADGRPSLIRLEPPGPQFILPVRLGVHASLRSTPRVRALIDFIVDGLGEQTVVLNPA